MKNTIVIIISLFLFISLTACATKTDDAAVINVHVTGVELSQSEISLYADKPEAARLDVRIIPEDADIQSVEWTSSNESVVHAGEDGSIYPCGVGAAEVIVKTTDGGYEAKCFVTVTTKESRTADIGTEYTDYDITLYDMVMAQMKALPISYDTRGADNGIAKELPAHDEEVEGFANPANFLTGSSRYQFLVLNEENGIAAEALDVYLNGKGVLSGKGDLFKNAAENNNISEVYLAALACLETKNGTTELAKGAEINSTTVYNLFGIREVSSQLKSGAKFAYEQGWTSVEKAIEGGARWLSENYLNNPRHIQNTLYKMRWNIEHPPANQYSCDVEWAYNYARALEPMFAAFPSAVYRLDIPVFEEGRAVAG